MGHRKKTGVEASAAKNNKGLLKSRERKRRRKQKVVDEIAAEAEQRGISVAEVRAERDTRAQEAREHSSEHRVNGGGAPPGKTIVRGRTGNFGMVDAASYCVRPPSVTSGSQ